MSRSYRTEKEPVKAVKNAARDKAGEMIYPRIIVHKLPRCEFHPLPKRVLKELIKMVPFEYICGLQSIELMPRMGRKEEYAVYRGRGKDKSIILYSLPREIWSLPVCGIESSADKEAFKPHLEKYAEAEREKWEKAYTMGLWFYIKVFFHELGHHYRKQYRHKNKISKEIKTEELKADNISRRLEKIVFKR